MFFMFMAAAKKRSRSPAPPRRTFLIVLGEMHVTVHPGQDLHGVRILEGVTARYFIDDREVDAATFDRALAHDR